MAIVNFSVVPLGTGGTSLSRYVAQVHGVLKDSGVKHQLHPMGTILEGPLEELMAVILRCHQVPFDHGAMRVSTTIAIDDRRDTKATAAAKVKSVEDKLA